MRNYPDIIKDFISNKTSKPSVYNSITMNITNNIDAYCTLS